MFETGSNDPGLNTNHDELVKLPVPKDFCINRSSIDGMAHKLTSKNNNKARHESKAPNTNHKV